MEIRGLVIDWGVYMRAQEIQKMLESILKWQVAKTI